MRLIFSRTTHENSQLGIESSLVLSFTGRGLKHGETREQAAIAHATSEPFWVTQCSTAIVSPCGGKSDKGGCARALVSRADLCFWGPFHRDAKRAAPKRTEGKR